jgi:uncharacterized protein YihD (DUF1040 family)
MIDWFMLWGGTQIAKDIVQNSDKSEVIDEIIKDWKENPETLYWFKHLFQNSNDEFLRSRIVRVIIEEWKNDPDLLPFLDDIAENDDSWHVRYNLVNTLDRFYKSAPDVLLVFKKCARQDRHYFVRNVAVKALVERRQYKQDIFTFLYCLALDDPFQRQDSRENNPRLTALKAICQNHRDRLDEVIDLLVDRSHNDSDEQVRKFAEEKLVK